MLTFLLYFAYTLSSIKYIGRRFTSVYILPIYNPVMPTPVVIIPPMNHIETNMEVHPWMVSPLKYSTKAKTIITMTTNVIAKPMKVMNFNGATEKEVMPSILKASIFFNGYLTVSAIRYHYSA